MTSAIPVQKKKSNTITLIYPSVDNAINGIIERWYKAPLTINLMWLLAALKRGPHYRVHYIRGESTICREKIKVAFDKMAILSGRRQGKVSQMLFRKVGGT